VEQRSVKRRSALLVALLAVTAVGVYAAVPGTRLQGSIRQLVRREVDARAPDGVRIRVQVLNASRVQGLARRATFHLRDRGFDVVESGNAGERRDSTLVLDRSGHPEWARLVAQAMGGAAVVARPDSSRYLDVTVLVGASWRPPPEPFYP
jgi:hypothetical protein